MQSYLIVGNPINTEKYALKKAQEMNAFFLTYSLSKIEDVRNLFDFTKLTLNQKTALLIKDLDLASEEAQNALLKNLEEPQKDLYYFVAVETRDTLLETIQSRCQIIELPQNISLSNKQEEKCLNYLKGNVGEKLQAVAKITGRDDAVMFLKNMILAAHKNDPLVYNEVIINAQETLKKIKANGNIALQLTIFAINPNI